MNVEGFADAAVLANRIFPDPLLLCVFDSASEKEAFVKKLPTIESQFCGWDLFLIVLSETGRMGDNFRQT